MAEGRNWMAALMLRLPASIRSFRGIPVLGSFLHSLSHRILPSDQKVWAQVEAGPAKGIWLELNPRTGQSYRLGETEKISQAVVAEKLRSGDVFYDLGANLGFFSLLAARIVGPTGKVFSFEPDFQIAERLRRNAGRNGLSNIAVVEMGVWSASGILNFVAADSSSPDRGVGRFEQNDPRRDGIPARCVSLDDFIQSAPAPRAIKCDVEGAEVEAFRGAEDLLSTYHPWILCELHSRENDRAWRELIGGFGYSFESVDSNHVLALPHKEI
jgi:FkbM family methyltransferase